MVNMTQKNYFLQHINYITTQILISHCRILSLKKKTAYRITFIIIVIGGMIF